MSLLSSLSKAAGAVVNTAKTVVTQPKAAITQGVKTIASVMANPVTAVTKGVIAAEKKTTAAPLSTNIAKILTTGAIAAGAVVGGAALAGSVSAGTLIPKVVSIAKSSPKASAIAGLAAPVVAGVVLSAPTKTVEGVQSAPSRLLNVGENIGKIIENPSVETVKNLYVENPVIAGTATAAAGYVVGKAVVSALVGTANVIATEKNTKALGEMPRFTVNNPETIVPSTIPSELPKEQATIPNKQISSEVPVLPSIATVKEGGAVTSTKRKKTKVKPVMQNFNQKVNVIVQNRNSSSSNTLNRRYIKKEVLLKT